MAALGKVLKQPIRITFCWVGVQVLQERSDRPNDLRHPDHAAIMAPVEAVIDKRLEKSCGCQQERDLRVGPFRITVDLCFYGTEHSSPLYVADDRGDKVDMTSTRH